MRQDSDDLGPHPGMHADQKKFIVRERAGFVQNALWHKNFADVVNARGEYEIDGFLRRQMQRLGRISV